MTPEEREKLTEAHGGADRRRPRRSGARSSSASSTATTRPVDGVMVPHRHPAVGRRQADRGDHLREGQGEREDRRRSGSRSPSSPVQEPSRAAHIRLSSRPLLAVPPRRRRRGHVLRSPRTRARRARLLGHGAGPDGRRCCRMPRSSSRDRTRRRRPPGVTKPTAASGVAVFDDLEPARYEIQASFPGFQTVIMRDVRLRAGDNRRTLDAAAPEARRGRDRSPATSRAWRWTRAARPSARS